MKSVKFLKSHRMYQPGEIAGFEDTFADKLIQSGFAVPLGAKGALKTATADVLVNPSDMAPPVLEPGSGEGDGVAPVNDPANLISTEAAATDPADATVVDGGTVEDLNGAQKEPGEAQQITAAATDPADANGADDATVEVLEGAPNDPSEAQKPASAEPAKPAKKPAGKKD